MSLPLYTSGPPLPVTKKLITFCLTSAKCAGSSFKGRNRALTTGLVMCASKTLSTIDEIPLVPPRNQNNNGRGYNSLEECSSHKMAQQDCKQDSMGKYLFTNLGKQVRLNNEENPIINTNVDSIETCKFICDLWIICFIVAT